MTESSRLETLRRRVESDPASLAFAALAEEYRRARRLDDAIETARKGLAKHPTYVSARVTLGRALLDARRFDAACDELETAIQAAPENLAALRALVEAHRGRGSSQRAVELLRRGVATFPQDRDLAMLLAELGASAPSIESTATAPAPVRRVGQPIEPPPRPMSEREARSYRQVEALETFLFAIIRERTRRAHAGGQD